LESKSRTFYTQNSEEILDIILFGSTIKGKDHPNDLDILIVFKNKKSLDLTYKFRKLLEPLVNLPVEVTSKGYYELFDTNFVAREALLKEGYSLVNHVFVANGLGYQSKVMFTYNLKNKNKSERMRFYYSLYGRGSPGMLKKLNSVKHTDTVILCPIEHQEEMRIFLQSWKIEFSEISLLIPERLQ